MRLALAAGMLFIAAGAACADDPRALLARYKCYVCHADNEAGAGPAYADVAAHYRGKPDAEATLVASIRNGVQRGGPWHMPPHPEVSVADAKIMIRYILSRKPGA